MGIYDDIRNSLLEAIDMEKSDTPLTQKPNMPAPTFVIADNDKAKD